jgi:DNA-directed RNA polymerase specialized sigma24 family protein
MSYRKFFYGDDITITSPLYTRHFRHRGRIAGTQVHKHPNSQRLSYVVECECGVPLWPAASCMAVNQGPPLNLGDARVRYWFRATGILAPKNAEAILDEGLSLLTDREREVLASRCGLQGRPHKTLDQLGHDFGVTRERIRQIESRARRKVKKHLSLDRSDSPMIQWGTKGDR